MLFSRYEGAANLVFEMDFELGMELIRRADTEKTEEMLYQRWLLGYEKVMSLNEFKQRVINATSTKEAKADDILVKVKGILDQVET